MKTAWIIIAALCVSITIAQAADEKATPAAVEKAPADAPKPPETRNLPAEQNPQYYADLGSINLRYGEFDKAVELFSNAIELGPDDKIDLGVAIGLGRAYLGLKDFDKAQAAFDMPVDNIDPERKAQYLSAVARLYKVAEQYERAEKALLLARDSAKDERDNVNIIQQLLELYKTTPLGKQAIAKYEKRLADNPKDIEAVKALMELYLYENRNDKNDINDRAAKMAALYAELSADNVEALRDLIAFSTATGDYSKAVDVCTKLIEKDPDNKAEYYSTIIILLTELGKHETVEQWALKAEKDGVKSDSTFDALAQAYARAGKKDKALQCLKKAMEINPDNPRGKFNYAKALLEYGKRDEAKKLLESLAKTDDRQLKPLVQDLLLRIYQESEGTKPATKDEKQQKETKPATAPEKSGKRE
ncbi:MAG TPA: tetratricopeptide repeat protein [Planctomycetota bacterium]|nr:tetratricopeptide repeat protein [Planctomycetota bacterium]